MNRRELLMLVAGSSSASLFSVSGAAADDAADANETDSAAETAETVELTVELY